MHQQTRPCTEPLALHAPHARSNWQFHALVLCPNGALCQQVVTVINSLKSPEGQPLLTAAQVREQWGGAGDGILVSFDRYNAMPPPASPHVPTLHNHLPCPPSHHVPPSAPQVNSSNPPPFTAPDFIVATPAGLTTLLREAGPSYGRLWTEEGMQARVRHVVLDEADLLLGKAFERPVNQIMTVRARALRIPTHCSCL